MCDVALLEVYIEKKRWKEKKNKQMGIVVALDIGWDGWFSFFFPLNFSVFSKLSKMTNSSYTYSQKNFIKIHKVIHT